MTGFFTVCNRYQLAEAIALGESILLHHKNVRYVIGYADQTAIKNLPAGLELIPVTQLEIPQLEEMSERYLDFELVHALRPWFARYLFANSDAGGVWSFLAPATLVCRNFEDLSQPDIDFFLTPNILRPLPPSEHVDDKRILNIGMFNSNAWIARNTENVRDLLDWWSHRTIDRAFFDLCNGMCLDQLWLNYVPVHVPKWGMLRHPLWHLGLHNTADITFSMSNQVPAINGELFYTIDFTGLQHHHPVWSDHTDLARHPGWRLTLRNYKSRLENFAQYHIPGQATYGRPAPVSRFRNFRKSIKSELERIITLIDKVEI